MAGPGIELIEGPDLVGISGPMARLEFRFDGDRWGHRIVLTGDERVIATALETPIDKPVEEAVGPTYQEVMPSRDGDTPVLLAVGKFGRLHYAAAFRMEYFDQGMPIPPMEGLELPPTTGGPTTLISADVAVRGEGLPRRLAATYAVHERPTELAWAAESGAIWEMGRPFTLTFERAPESSHVVQVGEAGRAACRAQVVANVDDGSRTGRLTYGWIVTDHGAAACRIARETDQETEER